MIKKDEFDYRADDFIDILIKKEDEGVDICDFQFLGEALSSFLREELNK